MRADALAYFADRERVGRPGVRLARKRPVTIEYIQYTGDNATEIRDWLYAGGATVSTPGWPLAILTLEGQMEVSENDYVIRGVAGEFYPCKPDIFAATYEGVIP